MVITKFKRRYITPRVSFEEEESVVGLLAGSITNEVDHSGGGQGDNQGGRGFAKESVFDDYDYKSDDFEYTIPE